MLNKFYETVSITIDNYKQARAAVEKKFTQGELTDRSNSYAGMNTVHTLNNSCLTIWGVKIGGTDFSRVIFKTVAMGLDNDCNAATAGSIVGAVVGKKGISPHWYRNFNNKIDTYLMGKSKFAISGLVKRFAKQTAKVYKQ
jgi:ADP-ribosylglycohydrolase